MVALMFSSIYSAKSNYYYNFYCTLSAILFELLLPFYLLARLSLKHQSNRKFLKVAFILGTVSLMWILSYFLIASHS